MINLDNGEKASLEFEKARYEYCREIFEREKKRKESLENKAQLILSLVTLLLGAIFLKSDFLESIKLHSTKHPSQLIQLAILISSGLAISLTTTLFFILRSLALQKYKLEHPVKFVSSLFAPNSDYLKPHTSAQFYKATAMSYAIALELNVETNKRKAKWVKFSWYGIITTSAFLVLFLVLSVYISLK